MLKKEKQTVAVLFGGKSSEHEISLRSALFVLKNFPEKYQILPVGIHKNGLFYSLEGVCSWQDFQTATVENLTALCLGQTPEVFLGRKIFKTLLLPYAAKNISKTFPIFFHCEQTSQKYRLLNGEVSCLFPVLHGQNGEDGRLQGVCELAELAYVGCDVRASVLGIDKDLQKRLARDAGVPVAKYEVVDQEFFQEEGGRQKIFETVEKNIQYPCFVKPNALGSAVATGRAQNCVELEKLLSEVFVFDQKALVEEPLWGSEVECAFLGTSCFPRVSVAGEIVTKDFYSYEEKYSAFSEAKLFVPARLSQEKMQELKLLAQKIAKATGIFGLCRIDFWNCQKTNRFIFNEINTLPGLTAISMFPKLWEYEGISAQIWIEDVIEKGYERQKRAVKSQYDHKPSL
jgi:D-alanine-D-alanine ligase